MDWNRNESLFAACKGALTGKAAEEVGKALKAQKRKAEAKSDRKESIRAETEVQGTETKKGRIEGEVCGKIHKGFGTESAD